MSRSIDYQIAVMQAFKDGKKIEWYNDVEEVWKDTLGPLWNWYSYDYRVKEEPKYVPYENTEELIEDFCKRSGAKRSPMGEPFIWVKYKAEVNIAKCLITSFTDSFAYISSKKYSLSELFDDFTYFDGSPCGKKAEQTINGAV